MKSVQILGWYDCVGQFIGIPVGWWFRHPNKRTSVLPGKFIIDHGKNPGIHTIPSYTIYLMSASTWYYSWQLPSGFFFCGVFLIFFVFFVRFFPPPPWWNHKKHPQWSSRNVASRLHETPKRCLIGWPIWVRCVVDVASSSAFGGGLKLFFGHLYPDFGGDDGSIETIFCHLYPNFCGDDDGSILTCANIFFQMGWFEPPTWRVILQNGCSTNIPHWEKEKSSSSKVPAGRGYEGMPVFLGGDMRACQFFLDVADCRMLYNPSLS